MARGLDGIIAAETVLSHTDPANGIVAIVFAVSRSAGWLGHAMEQQKTGRMILSL
jgi:citrate synthase